MAGRPCQWTNPVTGNSRAGLLVCRAGSAGDFGIAWSFDTAGVVVFAEGGDSDSLFQRWTNNAYLIRSS